MLTLIIVLGVLLVLAILYFIFRIGNLVSLVKGKDDDEISSVRVRLTPDILYQKKIDNLFLIDIYI